MRRKSPEKVQQDQLVDELYPFLPPNYAQIVRHFRPDIDAMRLYNVIRKRGTEADPEAYRALLMAKKPAPVERVRRKKYAPRTVAQVS
jgi:hypothetical protein